jgi:Di-haem cytochrome c peroxidase
MLGHTLFTARSAAKAVVVALVLLAGAPCSSAAEFAGSTGVLPPGTELGEEVLDRPRETFRSETRGGHQTYLALLGDVAFNSPSILGSVARQAGISCNTCHLSGATNPRLFIPGLSARPGTFDTTGHLFSPKADDGVLDPLTTPSLRGAHLLAPYGHDGRNSSLREFIHNVIVQEFGGVEPSGEIMDALVVYIEDIDFIPNPRLAAGGKLSAPASPAEKRGEALFYKPFPHNPELSCATCHMPSAAFVDHRQHDVGSGGEFKTPTLRNANFNAPYFHDGRYGTYAQVVAHFDRVFYLGLTPDERQDLVAYLQAAGDGEQALVPDDVDAHVREITRFSSVLDSAVAEHNGAVVGLTVDTIDRELRDLTESYPERKDSAVSGGLEQRTAARGSLKQLVLDLRSIEGYARAGQFEDAVTALARFHDSFTRIIPALEAAEPWSLFNREIHDAHFAALRRLYLRAVDPHAITHPRLDLD